MQGWGQMFKWQWSEATPWPPIAYVRTAQLYQDKDYQSLLDRFRSPVPVPNLSSSSDKTYKTIDTTTAKVDADGKQQDEKCAFFLG